MITNRVKCGLAAVAAGAILLAGAPAFAGFPDQPITLLVAFKAGGGADTLSRLVAKAIQKDLGWTFVVKNVPGGGGAIMAKTIEQDKPDGYTIGMSVSTALTFDPAYRTNLGYSTDDFTYLGTIANFQMGVVALADKGWKTLDDAMRAGKAKGELTWASIGVQPGFAARMAGKKYGVPIRVVPTQGGAGAMTEVLGGHVDLGWGAGVQAPYVDAGKMVILASGQNDRLKQAPDAKTFEELGIPVDSGGYFLMIGPKGIPADRLKILSDAIHKATQDPDVKTLIDKRLRLVTEYKDPAATRKYMLSKYEESKRLVESAKE